MYIIAPGSAITISDGSVLSQHIASQNQKFGNQLHQHLIQAAKLKQDLIKAHLRLQSKLVIPGPKTYVFPPPS